jgi:hypothetical protein
VKLLDGYGGRFCLVGNLHHSLWVLAAGAYVPEYDRGEDGKSGEEDGAEAGGGSQLGREGLTGGIKRLGAERGGHNTERYP